ncbi:hypothetical protein CRG98_032636 [Punica granatum]|uniref:Uncharacterized protein n=1 Tax=Punica granatum TaxID=22663 RepID=A0A2I0ISF8_PUNGR|nr:hypothetical protein CRG98_032636 [Punica granatum]
MDSEKLPNDKLSLVTIPPGSTPVLSPKDIQHMAAKQSILAHNHAGSWVGILKAIHELESVGVMLWIPAQVPNGNFGAERGEYVTPHESHIGYARERSEIYM